MQARGLHGALGGSSRALGGPTRLRLRAGLRSVTGNDDIPPADTPCRRRHPSRKGTPQVTNSALAEQLLNKAKPLMARRRALLCASTALGTTA